MLLYERIVDIDVRLEAPVNIELAAHPRCGYGLVLIA